jgi:endo-1,4-beta-xylanase
MLKNQKHHQTTQMKTNLFRNVLLASAALFTFSCSNENINEEGANERVSKTSNKLKPIRELYYPIGMSSSITSINDNDQSKRFVRGEFNSITMRMYNSVMYGWTEDSSKWGTLNFTEPDKHWNLAKEMGARVFGHCLVYHIALSPGQTNWIKNASVTNFENAIKNHIQTIVKRYKDMGISNRSYDVINEVIEEDGRNGFYRPTLFKAKYDTDEKFYQFIKKCFTWAKEADPAAKMFYNDYNTERDWATVKRKRVTDLVTRLKGEKTAGGVAIIDGIGFQSHTGLDTFNETNYETALKAMADTGLLVHISELDIAVNELDKKSSDNPYNEQRQGWQQWVAKRIPQIYWKVVPEAQKFGITLWDFSDKDTWLIDPNNNQRPNSGWDNPNFFWYNGWKKPSFFGLYSGIVGYDVQWEQ